ncbi:hypothetical protein [Chengkuizengella sediminis]|uniref:hypothetical protein n=1 Tax=Chengkuizengella sediminis TaxID=1885917 RepID=UPI001389AB7E|nr:hypothetical protein [Chengkuizengella sediminis]NDI33542.1 hypothetical protein [Chengkuizengella sediminis]
MGVFDKSVCDCCVCPMQCVLEQLTGVDVAIDTPISRDFTIITSVENFIVSTSDAGDIPICQITHVDILDPTNTIITNVLSALKPIKNSKGKCACCEDPMTNLLRFEIGSLFAIEFIGGIFGTEILGVGEGIVVGPCSGGGSLDIYSTCSITRVIPINQQQFNDLSRASRRTTSPPTT